MLKVEWAKHLEYQKRLKRLPRVMTPEEVSRLLAASVSQRDRAILSTIYACGLRLGEALRLTVSEIDSNRMVILIEKSKNGKDRYVMLPPALLELLREYYRAYRPSGYLFENPQTGQPFDAATVQRAFHPAREEAGIHRPVHVHTLRHSFTSHLLENGTDRNPGGVREERAHKGAGVMLGARAACPRRGGRRILCGRDARAPRWTCRDHPTHRIAISNRRLQRLEDGKATFGYKDRRNENRPRHMTLPAEDFLRRYLQHVLPSGFLRIRYYGGLSHPCRRQWLQKARSLLRSAGVPPLGPLPPPPEDETWEDRLLRLSGLDVRRCPSCEAGKLRVIQALPPVPGPRHIPGPAPPR